MLKKILLYAMAGIFGVFALGLILSFGQFIASINLSIAAAVVLIGLFVTFILVSEWERKRRDHRP